MSNVRTGMIAAAAALALGGGAWAVLRKPEAPVAAEPSRSHTRPTVQIVLAGKSALSRTVRLSGTLKSGSEARLSPKAGGRVVAVTVREGDAVRRGHALVRLDTSDTRRQVEQAEAGAAAARAVWQKAVEGERLKRVDVERRIREAEQGVELARLQLEKAEAGIRLQNRASQADVQRAQAGVDAARSALAKARKGARPEQREQVVLQVKQAEQGVETARKRLDDIEFLHGKGGLPRIRLDEAREGYERAQNGLAQAKAQLALVDAGATPEDIEAAEAQVRSAEAALSAAKTAAGREELDSADVSAARAQVRRAEDGLKSARAARAELEIARSDIRAARADYDRAQSAARLAAQQLEGAVITSPVDGVVTGINTNVGEMAGPGHPLVTVVGTSGVYLEAAVPARTLAELSPGQDVVVRVDALPGRTFRGAVRSIGTVAGPDGRAFPVEVSIAAPAGLLKPGALARAEVELQRGETAVSVPLATLRPQGGTTVVWAVRDGRIEEVPVEVPAQNDRQATVRGGLRAGEQIIMAGADGLAPGDEVDTRVADSQ